MVSVYLDPKIFNPVYLNFIFKEKRPNQILYGGAGSGKSVAVCQKKILQHLREKRVTVCVRKVANTLKQSCFAELVKTMHMLGVRKLFDVPSGKTYLTIGSPGGGCFLFLGMDDPEKIKSITTEYGNVTDAWLEEASELLEEDIDQLSLRIRGKTNVSKEMIYSLNPTVGAKRLINRFTSFRDPEKDFMLHTTCLDNKFVGQDYIEKLKKFKETNPLFYQIYFLGELATTEGLVYPHYQICRGEFPFYSKPMCYGMDFGYKDPTVLVELHLVDNEVYAREVFRETEKTMEEIIKIMEERGISKTASIWCDHEPDRIKLLRHHTYNAKPAKKRKKESGGEHISAIDVVKSRALHIFSESKEMIEEVEAYSFKTYYDELGKKQFSNNPIDTNDHGMDAMLYGISSEWPLDISEIKIYTKGRRTFLKGY